MMLSSYLDRQAFAAPRLPIVHFDGDELTRLMVLHNVGVREERQVAIKKLDADFFEG